MARKPRMSIEANSKATRSPGLTHRPSAGAARTIGTRFGQTDSRDTPASSRVELPELPLRTLVIGRCIEIEIKSRVIDFQQAHLCRMHLQKLFERYMMGSRQFLEKRPGQEHRMPRSCISRRLADCIGMVGAEFNDGFESFIREMRLITQSDGPMSERRVPTIPSGRTLNRAEHSARRLRIHYSLIAPDSDSIQFRAYALIFARTHDADLSCANAAPLCDEMA